jgi:hypothetical protein
LLRAWAMKEKPKRENPLEPLIREIVEAGRAPFTAQKGILTHVPGDPAPYGDPRICPVCGEASRSESKGPCATCRAPFFRIGAGSV